MKKFLFNLLYCVLLPVGFVRQAMVKAKYGFVEWEDSARPWTYMFVQTYIVDFVEQ